MGTSAALLAEDTILTPSEYPHSQGASWASPKVMVARTQDHGFGLFAKAPILQGEVVLRLGGQFITLEQFDKLSDEMKNFPNQVADDLFFGPVTREQIGIADRVNHSCNPTVGFAGEQTLVALHHIEAAQEIAMDYATCLSIDRDDFTFDCLCGGKNCRGTIRGTDWKIPELQKRLSRVFHPYLRAKLVNQQPQLRRLRTLRAA